MVSEEIRNATQLRRRTRVPAEHRTPDRTEVADWIEEHAADEWGRWTSSDVEKEVDYSRQHVDNVLEHYFAPVEEENIFEEVADRLGIEDMEKRDELLGELTSRELLIYRLGYRDAVQDLQSTEE
ncbi:hypothetical protein [Halobacterium hubeiense]|uniref:hypothetical protein n=1 Tax=Halobacterium hubeiense TaxID=1407499 RepID=UPI003C7150D0